MRDPSWVDVSGQRVTWTSPSAPGGPHNEVYVYDLSTRTARVVAGPAHAGGETDWSRISGDLVVYTDQAVPLSEENDRSPWRIVLLDLRSGRQRVIDKDRGGTEEQFRPSVAVAAPWVAWAHPTPVPDRYDLFVLNADTNEKRTILSDADMFHLQLSSTNLTFSVATDAGRDLWAVELVGAEQRPRQLTTSSRVAMAGRRPADTAVYSEVSDAGRSAVFVIPIAGGPPVELARDQTGGANPVATPTFAAWYGRTGSIEVGALAGGGRVSITPKLGAYVPTRIGADGDLLVWGEHTTDKFGREADVVIARVSLS